MQKKILKVSLFFVLLSLFLHHFFIINTSPSLPEGIYLKTWNIPQNGDIVLVSPPDLPVFRNALKKRLLSHGISEAGSCHIIKIMAASEGDEIVIQKDGMFVNGKKLANSQRQNWQIDGMAELPISKKLQGEVLLYTPHPLSFDSRYFGPIDRDTIISSIKPLLLWN